MGKKQHQKDKMYITATEWREQVTAHELKEFSSTTFSMFIYSSTKYILVLY